MSTPATQPPHTAWPRAVVLGIVLAAVVGLIVMAFSWPSVTSSPRDLPIAIAGSGEQVDAVASALEQNAEGVFAITTVADRDAAVALIEQRQAYGAIILVDTPEVLTASAASPASNQLMVQLHAQIQAIVQEAVDAQATAAGITPPDVTVALTDVVPLASTDSRGTGLTAAAFPLVLGGMIGGIAITIAISGVWRRVVALFAYAIVAGLVITSILQGWFGVLQGDYLTNTAAFSLTLLAMGATIVGFGAIFGRPGIAVGPVLFLLIANPIASAAAPKEFLPAPWGEIGQWLPPGAGVTLIRDLSYFPSANATFPWLVLTAWSVGGLILAAVGHYRNAGRLVLEEPASETDTTPEAASIA